MGWQADANHNPSTNRQSEVRTCSCGQRLAVVYCHDCAKSYCHECHDANNFSQHRLVQLDHTAATLDSSQHRGNAADGNRSSVSEQAEQVGKLLLTGSFDSNHAAPLQSSPFFTGIDSEDPDQELSPTPPTKSTSSSSTDSSSYDLWGSWSVRAYGRRSDVDKSPASTPSGLDEWRGFKSMAAEGQTPALSPVFSLADEENLPLSSLNRPFRSMSFASDSDDEAENPPSDKRTLRPRSFSDYTSLGTNKLNDIWTDRVPRQSAVVPARLPVMAPPSPAMEVYQEIKTSVASRHVIIKTTNHEELDSFSIRSLLDTLNGYGAVASVRDDFAHDGLLFCTFFELKAAIGAVKMWFTTTSPASETTVVFAVPYEPLSEINCATVLVQLHGGGLLASFSDMRQLCSRYGEVASVLDKDAADGTASQYIVEFNDARDVPAALAQLAGAVLPSGQLVSISRSHPPTFDPVKIALFEDRGRKEEAVKKPPRFVGNRPKSYSESTTMLASPSSTSSSSPLALSFLDVHGEGEDRSLRLSRVEEPSPSFSHRLPPASRVRDSARPRSSSAYASLSSSSLGSDGYGASSLAQSPPPPFMQPSFGVSSHHAGPIRTASDPGFRHSYASSTCSSVGSVGRNDQGTGEFSLSIDRVASGLDTRTTLMVRNIPNKYTQQMLLAEINAHHHGRYDFFYLPIDFKNKCNMGYAFINFIEAASIVPFYQEFDAQKWTNFNSEKVCAISYARLQGKQAMITRFQNSSLLDKHESYRPLVFHSSGPNRGRPETFPAPKQAASASHHQHHHQHHPHQHHHGQFVPKKHHHHPHLAMADEYHLLGRLYAQQQHALMANAHAAAAMLHGLAVPPTTAPFLPQRSFQFRGGYPPHDRRQAQPFPHQSPGASAAFPGSSGFSPSPA